MTHKQITMVLMSTLLAQMVGARAWIWYQIKPWPCWWKLLLAALGGMFVTAAFLHSADLLDDFLMIFFKIDLYEH